MQGLMILANGFEDTEVIACRDVLLRSGLKIVLASGMDDVTVESKFGVKMIADTLIANVKAKDFDFLVIPGGSDSVSILDKDKNVEKLIKDFANDNKLIAAICAGPYLIAKLDLFEKTLYTCYPNFKDKVKTGRYVDRGVVKNHRFITAKSMFYTVEFTLEIVQDILGRDTRNRVYNSLKGRQ